MSTESQSKGQAPRHTDVAFEEKDIETGSIYGYMLALGGATVAALVICILILRFTAKFSASLDTPPPPSRESLGKDLHSLPPEPRLQGFQFPGQQADPQADLRKKMREDAEANEKLAWIDKSSGIAQIPLKEAMKIIAEKGLPAVPAPSAEKRK